MSIQVQEYLRKFEPKDYKNKDNIILLSDEDINYPLIRDKYQQGIFDGTPMFFKKLPINTLIFGLASGNLFNHVRIPTPHGIICQKDDLNELLLGTQDIGQLPCKEIEIHQASDLPFCRRKLTFNMLTKVPSKWTILYNNDERQELLKIMTEECLDQLINIMLIDELRADNDRHWGNFFFYKEKGADKFQGIIVIDVDNTRLLRQFSKNPKVAFPLFKHSEFISWTALHYTDKEQSYAKRIKALQKLIQNNNLNNGQIATLKQTLAYDLPKEIKNLSAEHGLSQESRFVYDMTSRLWEYNNQHLRKEL